MRSLRQVPSEALELALKTAEEHGTGVDVNKRNMLYREEVKLNLDSVSDSVDSVTEFIMERCQGIRGICSPNSETGMINPLWLGTNWS